jgi:AcrR family transcriptional regulator
MDNREKILRAALALFASRGYDAVGVQEICDACEITKPTLYHYFASKQGLLDVLFAESYKPFLERVAIAAEYHRDIVVNLESIARAFFDFAREAPEFNRFAIGSSFAPRESDVYAAQRKYSEQLYAILEKLFTLAVKEHGNMRNKERQLALSFLGLLRSFVGLYVSRQTPLDDAVSRAVVKQFMYGIFS